MSGPLATSGANRTPSAAGLAATAHAASSKTTPVDADELPLVDSAASAWSLKKLTWANLKAAVKSYFDTLARNYAAKTHASAHAGAATYNVDRTITGGAGGAFTAATINLPAGNYTLNFAYAPAGAAESFTNIDLVAAGATWGTPNVSGFATPTAISHGYRLTIESTPAQLEVSLSHTSSIVMVVSGVISESGKTAEFDISAVVTAGSDPVTVKSSQIVDAGYGSCVALLDSNATLPLANGGTGAATAGAALTNLGATAVGSSLVTAANAAAALAALGILVPLALPTPTLAQGWSYSDGVYTCNVATGYDSINYNNIGWVTGSVYMLRFYCVTRTSGSLQILPGNQTTFQPASLTGTTAQAGGWYYAGIIIPSDGWSTQGRLTIRAAGANGFIGSISDITLTKLF